MPMIGDLISDTVHMLTRNKRETGTNGQRSHKQGRRKPIQTGERRRINRTDSRSAQTCRRWNIETLERDPATGTQ